MTPPLRLLLGIALGLTLQLTSSTVLQAEEPAPIVANGDLSQGLEGWDILFADELKDLVTKEVVADGYEGKPALKIAIGDTDLNEAWRGRVSVKTKLEPGASYTLKVFIKSEPDDSRIELSASGRLKDKKDSELLGERQGIAPTQAWEEFTYQFTAPAQPLESSQVSFGNLMRPGITFWFANLTITKD